MKGKRGGTPSPSMPTYRSVYYISGIWKVFFSISEIKILKKVDKN